MCALIAFKRYIYKARKVEFPNRRKLTLVEGLEDIYAVSRVEAEGIIQQEGDQWAPAIMTDLEDRISEAVTALNAEANRVETDLNENITKVNADLSVSIKAQNTSLTKSIADTKTELSTSITNTESRLNTAIKDPRFNVNLRRGSWQAYDENGETFYRQVINGLNGVTPATKVDLTASVFYTSKLLSNIGAENINGTVFATTAIIPTIDINAQATLHETR